MKKLTDPNPYEILGVDVNASKSCIREALARHNEPGSRKNAREAHDILVSPEKRLTVDAFIPNFTQAEPAVLSTSEELPDWDRFIDRRAIIQHDAQAVAELVVQQVFHQPRLEPESPTPDIIAPVIPTGDLFEVPAAVTADELTRAERTKQHPVLPSSVAANRPIHQHSKRAAWIIGFSALTITAAAALIFMLILVITTPHSTPAVAVKSTLPALDPAALIATATETPNPTSTVEAMEITSGIPQTNPTIIAFATNTPVLPTPAVVLATASSMPSSTPVLTTILPSQTMKPRDTARLPTLTNTPRPPTRTPVPTVFKTTTPVIERYVITSRQAVNVRACPRTDCAVITSFEPGTTIDVDKLVDGDAVGGNVQWYHLVVNNKDAYIHSSLAQAVNEP